jgi:hypothetical protein
MTVHYILAGTPEAGRGLEGFPDTDIIRISYNFPNGIQVCFLPLSVLTCFCAIVSMKVAVRLLLDKYDC